MMKRRLRQYAVLVCFTLMLSTVSWARAEAHPPSAQNEDKPECTVENNVPKSLYFITVLRDLFGTLFLREHQESPDHRVPTGRVSDRFPNILLRTQHSRPVRFYEDLVKNKTVIIDFMYTTCDDDCALTTANLVRVHEFLGSRVGHNILMLSISIDSNRDTPQALRRYAERYGGLKPGWFYLTGDYDEIDSLRRKLGVYDLDPIIDADKASHAGIITFGNDKTDRWAALPALTNSKEIARTILRITRDTSRRR